MAKQASESKKIYLGDGAYAEYTIYGAIVLTTSNGYTYTNRIELDESMLKALNDFVNRVG